MAAPTTIDPDDGADPPRRIPYYRPERHRPTGSAPPTTIERPGPDAPNSTAAPGDPNDRELPADLAARFTRTGFLGAGQEASVLKCVDHAGTTVAIKLYWRPPTYTLAFDDPRYATNFAAHNTVRFLERGIANSVHYEVMEYCPGTLEFLIVGQAGVQLATTVLEQVSSALAGFQGTGGERLVHSDLKPSNILLRGRSPIDLVLADFGLTADLGPLSRVSNMGQGTIAYNAPELLRFKTPAADWWSLGMVMYQVLVGRSYFQRDDLSWIDDYTIQSTLLAGDVSLTALDTGTALGTHTERWKHLLAGLLTRDTQHRWGAVEVRAWLAGENPPIFRSVTDTPDTAPRRGRAASSFPIPGVGEFYDAAELGAAMAAHPGNAARALTGPGRRRLITWLTTDVGTGDTYPELTTHGEKWGPDELVTYFIARLAPEATLRYRDTSVHTPADLRALAGRPDGSVRKSLYQHELLSCLNTIPARDGFKMVDSNWHDLVASANEIARQHSVPLDNDSRDQIMARGLLLAASDETLVNAYAAQVQAQLNTPSAVTAREIGWFATLRAGLL